MSGNFRRSVLDLDDFDLDDFDPSISTTAISTASIPTLDEIPSRRPDLDDMDLDPDRNPPSQVIIAPRAQASKPAPGLNRGALRNISPAKAASRQALLPFRSS
jgi:hypothetical protein